MKNKLANPCTCMEPSSQCPLVGRLPSSPQQSSESVPAHSSSGLCIFAHAVPSDWLHPQPCSFDLAWLSPTWPSGLHWDVSSSKAFLCSPPSLDRAPQLSRSQYAHCAKLRWATPPSSVTRIVSSSLLDPRFVV